jgi:penicillin-binding protein 1A
VAVWVGYPNKLVPMKYEFAGGPVAGGTYPAEIFGDFMSSWVELRDARRPASDEEDQDQEQGGYTPYVPVEPSAIPPAEQAAPTETAPAPEAETVTPPAEQAPAPTQQPAAPEVAPAPPATPAPEPPPAAPPATPGEGGGVSPGEAPP